LAIIKVEKVYGLMEPVLAYNQLGNPISRSPLFSTCTHWTLNNCIEDFEQDGPGDFNEWIEATADQFQIQLPPKAPNGKYSIDTLLYAPTAHALLLSCKAWTRWAFPLVEGRVARAFRMNLANAVIGKFGASDIDKGRLGGAIQDDEDDERHSSSQLQGAADAMRECLELPGVSTTLQDTLYHHIVQLQRLSHNAFRDEHMTNTKLFDVEVLIHSVVASGLIRDISNFREVLVHAIYVITKNKALQKHLIKILDKPNTVPSPTTLLRHRLTLHMGYCRLLADISEAILSSKGGAASWSTLDLSPHRGVEYVLHGMSMMKQSDLVAAFDLANALFEHNQDERETQDKLSEKLRLEQGVPVGCGSGRKSLQYKLHGKIHASRLITRQWTSAAKLVNSSITMTGDMAESTMQRFHGNVRTLFGNWVIQADAWGL
jgi:hypothetical protein